MKAGKGVEGMSDELAQAEQFIGWMRTKAHLNATAGKAARRLVKRGQVYWCHFGLNVGSEISKCTPRPAVVIQNFAANRHSGNTIVVPVTHNKSVLPCMVSVQVLDEEGQTLLDGQVNTSNILCVSKARLADFICTLPGAKMREIDRSLAISLELMKYYQAEVEKYEKLKRYTERVKSQRNQAQDQLAQVRLLTAQQEGGQQEDFLEQLKKLLDSGPTV